VPSLTQPSFRPNLQPISNAESLQLPYLQAVVKEGLRMFVPGHPLLLKQAPPEGDVFDGNGFQGVPELHIANGANSELQYTALISISSAQNAGSKPALVAEV